MQEPMLLIPLLLAYYDSIEKRSLLNKEDEKEEINNIKIEKHFYGVKVRHRNFCYGCYNVRI